MTVKSEISHLKSYGSTGDYHALEDLLVPACRPNQQHERVTAVKDGEIRGGPVVRLFLLER